MTLTEGLAALSSSGSSEDPTAGAARAAITGPPAIPVGRPGHLDEMAVAAVFLASSRSSYVTGQTIHVDGGTHAAGG